MNCFWLILFLSGTEPFASSSFVSFRKDAYLPKKLYPETWGPDPTTGGRVHYILPVTVTGKPALPLTVSFNNGQVVVPQVPGTKLDQAHIDWARVEVNAGSGRAWVSFHSSQDDFIKKVSQITVTDASKNKLFDGPVKAPITSTVPVTTTWVATQKNFAELVVHIQNAGKTALAITGLTVNGKKQGNNSYTMQPGEHKLFVAPLASPLMSVWTVEYVVSGQSVGYGGVVTREVFPFEDWPKSSQCPFPEDNKDNFNTLKDLGLDTRFFDTHCADWQNTLKNARQNGLWLLPNEFTKHPGQLAVQDGVIALFVSDEPDSKLNKTQQIFTDQMQRRQDYPGLPTYCGGHTSKYNGAFSGITDIQGMDFYVAGCAPHVTSAVSRMRIQGAFDYMANTRENMKPGSVWGYSQFLCSDCWDVKKLNSGEITAQIASVFAAGNKGLMLFQSDVRSTSNPAWQASKKVFQTFSYVKELLRVGDKTDSTSHVSWSPSDKAQVTVIQAPTALVVVVVSWNADGYNDLTCAIGAGAHWKFSKLKNLKAAITLPVGFEPSTVQESTSGGLIPATITAQTSGGVITLSNINVDSDVTARVFVIHKK